MTTPLDPRAGKLCTHCNRPRPVSQQQGLRRHCESDTCTWWKCAGCGADNDALGRNSKTSLDGKAKDGRKAP